MTDRELDALVAKKVMGYDPNETDPAKWKWWNPNELTYGRRVAVPGPYSTDIAAAWEVVEKFNNTHRACMVRWFGKKDGHMWACGFARLLKDDVALPDYTHAEIMPRAICLAALKAVGVEV